MSAAIVGFLFGFCLAGLFAEIQRARNQRGDQ